MVVVESQGIHDHNMRAQSFSTFCIHSDGVGWYVGSCAKVYRGSHARCTLSRRSQHLGGKLASNTFWRPALVSCQSENALQVDHCGNKGAAISCLRCWQHKDCCKLSRFGGSSAAGEEQSFRIRESCFQSMVDWSAFTPTDIMQGFVQRSHGRRWMTGDILAGFCTKKSWSSLNHRGYMTAQSVKPSK